MPETARTHAPHIEGAARTIAELHAEHHRRTSPVQRVVDRSVNLIGRPKFIGVVTIFIAAWLGLNLMLASSGKAFDPAPFQYFEDIATTAGVYFTLLILVTQRRENQLSEHRDQLTLELAILGEQKSAKIIQLLEELRRDSPAVADRHDPEAMALSQPADTKSVSTAIGDTHAELRD